MGCVVIVLCAITVTVVYLNQYDDGDGDGADDEWQKIWQKKNPNFRSIMSFAVRRVLRSPQRAKANGNSVAFNDLSNQCA